MHQKELFSAMDLLVVDFFKLILASDLEHSQKDAAFEILEDFVLKYRELEACIRLRKVYAKR